MSFNEDILKILACPKCRGDLRAATDSKGLICESCKLLYPIENDIPILLMEDAVEWSAAATEQAD